MAKFYYGSIDLAKIDKSRIVEGKKGGKWINVTIWQNEDNQPDQYGYHASIQQSVSKEEREAGVKGPYIGNVKLGGQNNNQAQVQSAEAEKEDLPF